MLKKMQMPKKRKMEEELDMSELDMESMPEEMAEEESPEESMEEGEMMVEKGKEPSSDLDMLSDDELMAEIKKRGLLSKLDEKQEMDYEL